MIATQKMGEVDYLTITFRRRPGPSDVDYVVESSGDCDDWSNSGIELIDGPSAPDVDGLVTVTYRDAIPVQSTACRAMRVRISKP